MTSRRDLIGLNRNFIASARFGNSSESLFHQELQSGIRHYFVRENR
jgi:hypothetical protein